MYIFFHRAHHGIQQGRHSVDVSQWSAALSWALQK